MKVSYIKNYNDFQDEDMILCLGYFDGFHLAHKEIFKKALELKNKYKKEAGILTFDMSVYDFIMGSKTSYLMSVDDKINEAEKLGFDSIYVIELSDDFVALSPDDFYNTFLKRQKALVCGFDYSFGKQATGNVSYLIEKGVPEVYIIDEIKYNGVKIGSNQIRELLNKGDVASAKEEIGRPYTIRGSIYKRNRYYALSSQEYYLPRNGSYTLMIKIEDKEIIFEAKIKKLDDKTGIVLKSEDNSFLSLTFTNRKIYSLSFIKSSNYIL